MINFAKLSARAARTVLPSSFPHLPVWLAPTYVAHTVLPLFLRRYTPFSQYTLHNIGYITGEKQTDLSNTFCGYRLVVSQSVEKTGRQFLFSYKAVLAHFFLLHQFPKRSITNHNPSSLVPWITRSILFRH